MLMFIGEKVNGIDIDSNLSQNCKKNYIFKLLQNAKGLAFFVITTDLILIYSASQLAAAIIALDVGVDLVVNMLE